MDAHQKAAAEAIAVLSQEKKELTARIEHAQARIIVIDAQLTALQPLAPPPTPAQQPQEGAK